MTPDQDARQAYVATQALTATPQRLRLMLIDAAILMLDRTINQWRDGAEDAAVESLIRCREIVTELIASIRPDGSQLVNDVLAIHVFMFEALTKAQMTRDEEQLQKVRHVLEEERVTWQEICKQMPEAPVRTAHQPEEILAPKIVTQPFAAFGQSASTPSIGESISFEA